LNRPLAQDHLFLRVTIFMSGFLLGLIPVLALVSGVLTRNSDPALSILLLLFALISSWFIYASLSATDRTLDKIVTSFILTDFVIILGALTLALPITLLIRTVQRRQRTATPNSRSSERDVSATGADEPPSTRR
jgi:hypothetical protein